MNEAPRGETILIVEDEDSIRGLLVRVLEKRGYRVLEAGDGAGALEVFRREGKAVDLALIDLVLPDLDGSELLGRLREMGGDDLPAIVTSGYGEERAREAGFPDQNTEFLPKPFDPTQLADRIVGMLEGRSRSRPAESSPKEGGGGPGGRR